MSPSRLLLPLAAAVTFALAAPAPAEAARACPGATAVPKRGSLDRARTATLCLLNRRRAARGLRRLRSHRRLRRAARRHARHMVRHRFFGHVSAVDGSTVDRRVRAAGYRRWSRVAENIAWGAGPAATPRRIVRAWMRSPGHRANILYPKHRHVGIGIVTGAPRRVGGRAATYATNFGARR